MESVLLVKAWLVKLVLSLHYQHRCPAGQSTRWETFSSRQNREVIPRPVQQALPIQTLLDLGSAALRSPPAGSTVIGWGSEVVKNF